MHGHQNIKKWLLCVLYELAHLSGRSYLSPEHLT